MIVIQNEVTIVALRASVVELDDGVVDGRELRKLVGEDVVELLVEMGARASATSG
jgi:hypothetical protein